MAQDLINVGTVANDRTGDTWRAAMQKVNENETQLFDGLLTNVVPINQESDFPVQDASTLTIPTGEVYWLQADMVTSKTVVAEQGSVYTALNQRGITHTYTGSGDAFLGIDADFVIERIGVTCTNVAAQYFNFSETVGGTKTFVANFLNIIGSGKVGTFNKVAGVNFIESIVVGANDGISFFGATVVASIFKLFMQSAEATFIGIDLGTATSTGWDFTDFSCVAPVGAIGITGLANSGNVPTGARGMIEGGSFTGGMTSTTNVFSNDIRWDIRDNQDIPDSRNAADVYLTGGTETIVVANAGDWLEIGVPVGVGISWASDISDRFTVGTDGVITYDGEKDIEVAINGRATVEKVGGGANVIEVRIAKNWTGLVTDSGLEKSRGQTQSANPTTVPIGALIPLIQGDDIRPIFSNVDGTSDILANVSSLAVVD